VLGKSRKSCKVRDRVEQAGIPRPEGWSDLGFPSKQKTGLAPGPATRHLFRSFDAPGKAGPHGVDSIFMVKIRLKRTGAKNSPVYRVVVTDSRSPRDGKFIEELGTYHPSQKAEINFTLDLDRAKYWMSVGAQASETVASMIKKAGKAAA